MRQQSARPGSGYHLGIDLGSTYTVAAVCRTAEPARPEPVALGEAATAVATAAFLTDDGELLIGEAAARRSATEPQRVARGFTRRIGDDTPLVLGDRTITADEVAARFVACVVDLVGAREGGAPDGVAVTHPAGWGEHRRATLANALAAQGLPDVLLVSEPAAAALGHTGPAGLAPGSVLAVYDLGGTSFDATVLGGTADGAPELLGRPLGHAGPGRVDVGGVDFDERVLDHVRAALGAGWDTLDATDPDVLAAVAVLRRECTAAKEALSADVDAVVTVMLPGTHTRVRIGRADFEDRIRRDVAETVDGLQRALAAAGTDPSDPETVLLVGGSARIPLVPQAVSAALGRPVTVDADPRTTVARGAALAAHRRTRPAAQPAELPELPELPEAGAGATPAAAAPRRPAVPHLVPATPAGPAPARRTRSLRLRGTLVAAVATTGIALAAAATAYTLDPTLLSGEAPAALVEPAAGAADTAPVAADTPPAAEPAAPAPVAAAPAHAAPAPARQAATAPRKAVRPTAVVPAAPVAAPTSAPAPAPAPAPTSAPTSAPAPATVTEPPAGTPTTPGTGTGGGTGNTEGAPPPAGGGSDPAGTPPASSGGATGGGSAAAPAAPANPAPVTMPVTTAS